MLTSSLCLLSTDILFHSFGYYLTLQITSLMLQITELADSPPDSESEDPDGERNQADDLNRQILSDLAHESEEL